MLIVKGDVYSRERGQGQVMPDGLTEDEAKRKGRKGMLEAGVTGSDDSQSLRVK